MTEQTSHEASPSTAPETSAEPAPAKKRKPIRTILSIVAAVLVAGVAYVGFRIATADDGTHGIQVGQCVADKGSDDFEPVDCASPASVGKVAFVSTESSTSENAALDLCDKHGADTAFTSAVSDGGQGTVICVVGQVVALSRRRNSVEDERAAPADPPGAARSFSRQRV